MVAMLRKQFCLIGLHDWHVLESKTTNAIDREVACEIMPLNDGEYIAHSENNDLRLRKGCVHCGKIVDGIKSYRTQRTHRMTKLVCVFGADAIEPGRVVMPWKKPVESK